MLLDITRFQMTCNTSRHILHVMHACANPWLQGCMLPTCHYHACCRALPVGACSWVSHVCVHRSLIVAAIGASSTDHPLQHVSNTLTPDSEFWSSTGSQDLRSEESLLYALASPACCVKVRASLPGAPHSPHQQHTVHVGIPATQAAPPSKAWCIVHRPC